MSPKAIINSKGAMHKPPKLPLKFLNFLAIGFELPTTLLDTTLWETIFSAIEI